MKTNIITKNSQSADNEHFVCSRAVFSTTAQENTLSISGTVTVGTKRPMVLHRVYKI